MAGTSNVFTLKLTKQPFWQEILVKMVKYVIRTYILFANSSQRLKLNKKCLKMYKTDSPKLVAK